MNKEIHKRLLVLIKEIDEICKKYDIKYYAAGGTVIGAARHKGFIPWDDDADLYMTRENFEKFKVAFDAEHPAGRVLESRDNVPDYPGTIPRYMDITATVISRYNVLDTCSCGFVIDIFILDPVPDDYETIRTYRDLLNIYSDLTMPYYVFSNRNSDEGIALYEQYMQKVKTEGRDAVLAELSDKLFAYEEDECEGYVLRWGNMPHYFTKSMMGEPVYMEFEGMLLPMPHDRWGYLVQLYGEGWQYLPPPEIMDWHVNIVNADLRPQNFTSDLHEFIDLEEAAEVYAQRKEYLMKVALLRRPAIHIIESSTREALRLIQERRIHRIAETDADSCAQADMQAVSYIEKLFEAGKFTDIITLYAPYLAHQLSPGAVGRVKHLYIMHLYYKKYMGLPDEELYYLLFSLMMEGRLKNCDSILEARKGTGEILSDDLTDFAAILSRIKKIIETYYMGDFKKSYTAMLELNQGMHSHALFKNADLSGSMSMTCKALRTLFISCALKILEKNSAEYERLAGLLTKEALSDTSGGEILKIYGDYLWDEGRKSEAEEQYAKAAPLTKNGYFRLDILEKTGSCEEPLYEDAAPPLNSFQRTQFEMLEEIDDICKENDITYYLAKNTALFAYAKETLDSGIDANTIVMKPKDAKKFIEVFERMKSGGAANLKKRSINYPGNDGTHREFSIYYCNDDTCNYKWDRKLDRVPMGTYICIYILRTVKVNGGKRAQFIRKLESARDIECLDRKSRSGRGESGAHALIKLFGEKRVTQMSFENNLKHANVKSDPQYFIMDYYKGAKRKYIDKDVFGKPSMLKIYGREFPAATDLKKYLEGHKGKLFMRHMADELTYTVAVPRPLHTCEVDLSLDEFNQIFAKRLIGTTELENFKKSAEYFEKFDLLTDKTEKYWNIAKRAEARINMWQRYMPQKEEILNMYEAGDLDGVRNILWDYDKEVRTFFSQGLALIFDKDIFDIYIECLKSSGQERFAGLLTKLIPGERSRPVELV